MDTAGIDRAQSLRAFPTLSQAARMIGVATSTLTRRSDCVPQRRGDRDQVLPPEEVLRFASVYLKRSLNEVAVDLIDLASKQGQAEARRVESSVEAFFAGRRPEQDAADFLDLAKHYLPSALYEEVKKTMARGEGERPDVITGFLPDSSTSSTAPSRASARSVKPKRAPQSRSHAAHPRVA